MPGTFSPQPTWKEYASSRSRHASRHVRHVRAVMHVGIANPLWRGKRSRHSRRMHNLQFYVSGKRPICRTRYQICYYAHSTFILAITACLETGHVSNHADENCCYIYGSLGDNVFNYGHKNTIYVYIYIYIAPLRHAYQEFELCITVISISPC